MRVIKIFLLFILVLSGQFQSAAQNRPVEHGINLGYLADFSGQHVFKNIAKEARPWVHQPWPNDEGIWHLEDEPIELNRYGYPARLAPNRSVVSVLRSEQVIPNTPGEWVFLYDGDGDIELEGDIEILTEAPGRITLSFNNTRFEPETIIDRATYTGVMLRIIRTNPDNPIHNIRFLMPGTESTYEAQPFNPDFLDYISEFTNIRSMWWNNTMYFTQTWDERPLPQSYTYQQEAGGVPYEVIIDLCNQIQADCWICVPVYANELFIENLATLVRDHLHPTQKFYVEHGNELWNGGAYPQQFWHAVEQAQQLGIDDPDNDFVSNQRYHAYRSKRIFEITENVFGGTDRLVRVVGGWTGNAFIANQVLDYDDLWDVTDAYATAPYFGGGLGIPENKFLLETWTVEQVLDSLRKDIDLVFAEELEVKQLLDSRNKRLISYESGQHLVNATFSGQAEKMDTLFISANRHPEMYSIYLEYLTKWESNFGDLMAHYESISRFSQFGSWGLKEYLSQPLEEAHKFRAIVDFMNGHRWNAEPTSVEDSQEIIMFELLPAFPNPFNPITTFRFFLPGTAPTRLDVYSILGQKVITLENTTLASGWHSYSWNASNQASGVYLIKLRHGNLIKTQKAVLIK